MATTKEPYHYTACGLPNVWLVNGYKFEKNNYGEFVSIHDLDQLYQAIAVALVGKSAPLTGMEFRFLRKELDMSQKRLGEYYGRDRQSVMKWEQSDEVSELFDHLLRHIYQEHFDANAVFVDLVDRLNELDRQEYDRFNFETADGAWRKAS